MKKRLLRREGFTKCDNSTTVETPSAHSTAVQNYLKDQKRRNQKLEYIRQRRQNEALRQEEAEKDAIARKKRRMDSKLRNKEAERETFGRREKRKDQAVQKKEAARETPMRKDKRKDQAVQKKEAVRETPMRKDKRKDQAVQKKEAARETPMRKDKRKDQAVQKKEAARETPMRKDKRKDQAVQEQEAARETPMRREKRKDPGVQEQEAARETPMRREKRKDPGVQEQEAARETPMRREKRKDPGVQEQEAARETPMRREKRKDPGVQEQEAARETPTRREKRKDPGVHEQEAARETPMRREKRKDPAVRELEQARENSLRRIKRSLPTNVTDALKQFRDSIECGPTYICTCCNRFLSRSTVIKFKEEDYENDELVTLCRNKTLSVDHQEYIYVTCKNSIVKDDIPALAAANGLVLDEVPKPLSDLNQLESTFISRRIPFMKLLALPRGKQKAVHGCVVNVPVEPAEMTAILPRVSSPESMIPVKLKRKLEYRRHTVMQNVRPRLVTDALHLLKFTLNNTFYQDVEINEDWVTENEHSNSDLWNALTGHVSCRR